MSKNKTIVNKYRKNPTEKLAAVKAVVSEIAKKAELEEWGISIEPKPFSFSARILDKPMLVVGDSKRPTRTITDASSFQNQILQPVSLTNSGWVLIYDADDFKYANLLFENLHVASEKLGTSVEEPYWIELRARASPKDYENAIYNQVSASNSSCVVVLLP